MIIYRKDGVIVIYTDIKLLHKKLISIDLSGRDLSEYYEAEMYKSGELYETYDILQMLVNASIVSLSKEKKEYENPYEVLLGGTGKTTAGQSGSPNTGSESGGSWIKTFVISSILVLGCLVLAVFGIKKYKKYNASVR